MSISLQLSTDRARQLVSWLPTTYPDQPPPSLSLSPYNPLRIPSVSLIPLPRVRIQLLSLLLLRSVALFIVCSSLHPSPRFPHFSSASQNKHTLQCYQLPPLLPPWYSDSIGLIRAWRSWLLRRNCCLLLSSQRGRCLHLVG